MNSKRMYFGMLGLIVLFIVLSGAAVFLGNSMLQKKSAKLVELKLTHKVLEQQQLSLIQANKDVETYKEIEAIAQSIVPQDKDQAKTVRELVKIAADSKIALGAISFPTSNLGAVAPKSEPIVPGSTTPPAPVIPSVSQVKPVEGIKGLYQLEISVTSDPTLPITYKSLQDFLSRLEQNRRTSQVSQIVIIPTPSDINTLSFSLVINVYVRL